MRAGSAVLDDNRLRVLGEISGSVTVGSCPRRVRRRTWSLEVPSAEAGEHNVPGALLRLPGDGEAVKRVLYKGGDMPSRCCCGDATDLC